MNNSNEVTIGTQVWMVENLNVDKFRNGDALPEVKKIEEWVRAGEKGEPAWCYYDNDQANGEKYGKLYNWYAVNDPRGLAPEGWHVPSDKEWYILDDYIGKFAGKKMKSTSGFKRGNGTNKSGFSGLPGGWRCAQVSYSTGALRTFEFVGENGDWWSSTEAYTGHAWKRSLNHSRYLLRTNSNMVSGAYVRCLRD
jgi:uncharacterized protein (TIGR02145 family)